MDHLGLTQGFDYSRLSGDVLRSDMIMSLNRGSQIAEANTQAYLYEQTAQVQQIVPRQTMFQSGVSQMISAGRTSYNDRYLGDGHYSLERSGWREFSNLVGLDRTPFGPRKPEFLTREQYDYELARSRSRRGAEFADNTIDVGLGAIGMVGDFFTFGAASEAINLVGLNEFTKRRRAGRDMADFVRANKSQLEIGHASMSEDTADSLGRWAYDKDNSFLQRIPLIGDKFAPDTSTAEVFKGMRVHGLFKGMNQTDEAALKKQIEETKKYIEEYAGIFNTTKDAVLEFAGALKKFNISKNEDVRQISKEVEEFRRATGMSFEQANRVYQGFMAAGAEQGVNAKAAATSSYQQYVLAQQLQQDGRISPTEDPAAIAMQFQQYASNWQQRTGWGMVASVSPGNMDIGSLMAYASGKGGGDGIEGLLKLQLGIESFGMSGTDAMISSLRGIRSRYGERGFLALLKNMGLSPSQNKLIYDQVSHGIDPGGIAWYRSEQEKAQQKKLVLGADEGFFGVKESMELNKYNIRKENNLLYETYDEKYFKDIADKGGRANRSYGLWFGLSKEEKDKYNKLDFIAEHLEKGNRNISDEEIEELINNNDIKMSAQEVTEFKRQVKARAKGWVTGRDSVEIDKNKQKIVNNYTDKEILELNNILLRFQSSLIHQDGLRTIYKLNANDRKAVLALKGDYTGKDYEFLEDDENTEITSHQAIKVKSLLRGAIQHIGGSPIDRDKIVDSIMKNPLQRMYFGNEKDSYDKKRIQVQKDVDVFAKFTGFAASVKSADEKDRERVTQEAKEQAMELYNRGGKEALQHIFPANMVVGYNKNYDFSNMDAEKLFSMISSPYFVMAAKKDSAATNADQSGTNALGGLTNAIHQLAHAIDKNYDPPLPPSPPSVEVTSEATLGSTSKPKAQQSIGQKGGE